MKQSFILLAGLWLVQSCTVQRDLQVTVSEVRLVRIDTTLHYSGQRLAQLTWECNDNGLNYVCYLPLENNPYKPGVHMFFLRQR